MKRYEILQVAGFLRPLLYNRTYEELSGMLRERGYDMHPPSVCAFVNRHMREDLREVRRAEAIARGVARRSSGQIKKARKEASLNAERLRAGRLALK